MRKPDWRKFDEVFTTKAHEGGPSALVGSEAMAADLPIKQKNTRARTRSKKIELVTTSRPREKVVTARSLATSMLSRRVHHCHHFTTWSYTMLFRTLPSHANDIKQW